MKKLLLLLLAVALVLTACGQEEPVTPEGDKPAEEGDPPQLLSVGTVYNADVVNIRMEPDEDARILDTASRGVMFQIVDYDPASAWQKITYRGETAYISSDYLYMQEWESGTKLDIGTIIGDSGIVNVRNTPSADGQVVLVALKGAKFVVVTIDEGSGWYQVGFPEGVGYIEPQYLSVQSTTIEKAFFS